MSLTGRFSTLLLAMLGLVLVAFSTAIYASARVYLNHQLGDRLTGALAVLAAAAEVHPEGVEWEPHERVLPLGQETGLERLRWMVYDGQGHRIDHSRNLDDDASTAEWTPRPGSAVLPRRLTDREGQIWRVEQRRVAASREPSTGSQAAGTPRGTADEPASADLHPALVFTACASIAPTEATLSRLAWLLIAVSLSTWGLAALLCRRLSRHALTPLTHMVESARGLDASDAGWSLPQADTGDELDELGRAFNELLSRLHIAFERQRRFSGDASHQLRTPVTVLIGQLEVALRRERPAEEYRRALVSALGGAIKLGRIVEALLFLARAEADAQPMELEPVDLDRWTAAHLALQAMPGSGPAIVHKTSGRDDLIVRAHPPLLGQLLDNLLDNACKYGGQDGPVTVETRASGNGVILAVEDSGPGVPQDDLPHVFEPFYRSARPKRDALPGVGLGLAIVKRIADVFRATVTAGNRPERGFRIEVSFPVRSPDIDWGRGCRSIAQEADLDGTQARAGLPSSEAPAPLT